MTKKISSSAILALLVITIIGTWLPITTVNAQQKDLKNIITLNPESFDKQGKPGETIKFSITAINNSSFPVRLKGVVRDFYVSEEDTVNIIGEEEIQQDPEILKFSVKNWITLSGLEKDFAAGEARNIPVTISIPKDAPGGGHYGIIFFSPETVKANIKGSGAAITGEVGTLLALNVAGATNLQGGVEDFRTGIRDEKTKIFTNKLLFSSQGLFEKSKIDFAFAFTNNSPTHFKPKGFIMIKNFSGSKIEEIPIQESRVFPKTTRNIYTHYEKELLPGIYKARMVTNDSTGKGYDLETSFIIFPFKLIAIILATIAFVILVAYLYGKYIERKYRKLGIKLEK